MRKYFLTVLLFFIVNSCSWFDYHPYDGRLNGELYNNAKNIGIIEEKLAGKTSFKFAFISDTQRWYDDLERAVKDLNNRPDIDFIIHGGDLTDFGLTNEFLLQRDILNRLPQPYVAVIGNHDCLANGEEIFEQVFGKVNVAFMAGNTKFLCLNTNALEYDYSRPVPDFQFIRNQHDPEDATHERTIAIMHARPLSEQFNNNVADVFHDELKKFPELLFCANGHDHALKITNLFEDGVIYYGVPNIHKRSYFIFTITEDTYEYEVVEF